MPKSRRTGEAGQRHVTRGGIEYLTHEASLRLTATIELALEEAQRNAGPEVARFMVAGVVRDMINYTIDRWSLR